MPRTNKASTASASPIGYDEAYPFVVRPMTEAPHLCMIIYLCDGAAFLAESVNVFTGITVSQFSVKSRNLEGPFKQFEPSHGALRVEGTLDASQRCVGPFSTYHLSGQKEIDGTRNDKETLRTDVAIEGYGKFVGSYTKYDVSGEVLVTGTYDRNGRFKRSQVAHAQRHEMSDASVKHVAIHAALRMTGSGTAQQAYANGKYPHWNPKGFKLAPSELNKMHKAQLRVLRMQQPTSPPRPVATAPGSTVTNASALIT